MTISHKLEQEIAGILFTDRKLFDDHDVESRWFEDRATGRLIDRLRTLRNAADYSPEHDRLLQDLAKNEGTYPRLADILDWQGGYALSLSSHLDSLRRHWMAREGRRLALLAAEAIEGGTDPAEALVAATEAISALGEGERRSVEYLDEATARVALEIFRRRLGEEQPAISTGFPSIDDLIVGFKPGKTYILAARTSVGKSALGMQMADAMHKAGPVMVFSLEMTADDLSERRLSAALGIAGEHIARGTITDADDGSIMSEVDRLGIARFEKRLPFGIVSERVSVAEIEMHLRKFERKHGKLAGVMVDYIQLIQGPQKERREVIAEASRCLKAMAKRFQCPFLILAQVNRDAAKLSEAPEIHHLGESGSIENDADVIMMIHRPDLTDKTATPGLATIHFRKHRGGPLGQVHLHFDKPRARFMEDTRL